MPRRKRRRRRHKGGTFIPGTGIFNFLSGSGRRKAIRTGAKDLKKDANFIAQLLNAYVVPKLRKR